MLGLSILLLALRRRELVHLSRRIDERRRAVERGSHTARLQYPHVDLSRCSGCGSCIDACPEEQVLEIIHGQAMVVHGARCVGHGRCAEECPFDAIAVTFADLAERRDLPAIEETLEARGVPGLFLAGEVTGFALIKTAIEHGTAVGAEVARRVTATNGRRPNAPLDLCIVGAGPAGLACALEARARGLDFVLLERDSVGGAVAKYPRRKLVMTQPVSLPIVGGLDRSSYSKEELMEVWTDAVARAELPVRSGVEFLGADRDAEGAFHVHTNQGDVTSRHLCLAVGRRGTPRKLGVPGEERPKVTYGLLDARSYEKRDLLVIGGGDSAVEAALALAAHGDNHVTLSYRGEAFTRIKAGNEERLEAAVAERKLATLHQSEVRGIEAASVELVVRDGQEEERRVLTNDDVFVMIGGRPPFPMLEAMGVSFDPADRAPVESLSDRGPGLLPALITALVCMVAGLAWVVWFGEYYDLSAAERPDHRYHELLHPSGGLGVTFGIGAVTLMLLNLAYLLRRSRRVRFAFGSLGAWMKMHLVTGVLAFLLAILHSAMQPGDTLGGHALLGLAVLVISGAVGRYFYSFVPRAANGRELEIDEVRRDLSAISAEWSRIHPGFGERAEELVRDVAAADRWHGSFLGRVGHLVGARGRMRHAIARIRASGRAAGVPEEQLDRFAALARRAQRTLLTVDHLEEFRALLQTWRWGHRWVALLVVLTLAAHIFVSLRYGELFR